MYTNQQTQQPQKEEPKKDAKPVAYRPPCPYHEHGVLIRKRNGTIKCTIGGAKCYAKGKHQNKIK